MPTEVVTLPIDHSKYDIYLRMDQGENRRGYRYDRHTLDLLQGLQIPFVFFLTFKDSLTVIHNENRGS